MGNNQKTIKHTSMCVRRNRTVNDPAAPPSSPARPPPPPAITKPKEVEKKAR
ncbi:hypothetical protein HanPSC8_Chr04g0137591 [Helianthus annuus]|nr:hypothetical protein HanPSC8_Chr04g0137591 [Helianthus annuus]